MKTPEGKKIGLVNQEKYRIYGKGKVRTGNCKGYILKLEPGCILFFRKNIIHGSSGKKTAYYLIKKNKLIQNIFHKSKGYTTKNIRYFMYIDMPHEVNKRNSKGIKPRKTRNFLWALRVIKFLNLYKPVLKLKLIFI